MHKQSLYILTKPTINFYVRFPVYNAMNFSSKWSIIVIVIPLIHLCYDKMVFYVVIFKPIIECDE